MSMQISSTAFGHDERIPLRYSGDGEDISPPLTWSGLPDGTEELALICDDPDAPTPEPWVHWVIYGISPALDSLPEGLPTDAELSEPAALQGSNTWEKVGYGGPAPPRGHGVHHYHFRLYALKTGVGLQAGATKKDLLAAMQGKILDEAVLTGTYKR